MKTMTRWARNETGMALIVVLLMIFIFVAVGAVLIMATDRNSELRGTYQKNVAGFQAAEAGINVGAATVLNKMSNNNLPSGSDCNANFGGSPLSINSRSVTYTLSGCGQSAVLQTLPADDPFAGANADVYTYTLTSNAVNSLGFTEANLKMQFYARDIPVFQFVSFLSQDLAITPGAPYLVKGRIHTNGDLYLSTNDCGASGAGGGGLQVMGPVTVVGNLWRGARTTNNNIGHVWISTDGTQANEVILGVLSQGDMSCGGVATPRRGPIPASEVNTFGGRIRTGVKNITLPGGYELYCAPWDCPVSMAAGANAYWQKADLRIVLDLTAAPAHLSGGYGPALPPVNVLDSLGNVDSARTTALHTLMQNYPGVITYTDVPTSGTIDCRASLSGGNPQTPNCEGTYSAWNRYTPHFPTTTSTCPGAGLSGPRSPRARITQNNYCYDYRYGGYYDWKDDKPRIILNIDWMAVEEYNRNNANVFFNPAGAISGNNGVVVFLSVKGANSTGVNNYGVRVLDAARTRRGSSDIGVTFSSDQAMYVAGNFNCPTPNTSGGTGVPETCGANGKKSTSLVGDKIEELSCAWLSSSLATTPCSNFSMDSDQWPGWSANQESPYRLLDEHSTTGNVPGAPNPPFTPGGVAATTTYYNFAMLAGADHAACPGNPGGINCGNNWNDGGSPNLNEDWTGQQRWWIGSNVSLDTTRHTCWAYAAGVNPTDDPAFTCTTYTYQGYGSGQRYAPPQRLDFYDTSFNTPANWPPLTPFFVSLRQVLFTEPFQ